MTRLQIAKTRMIKANKAFNKAKESVNRNRVRLNRAIAAFEKAGGKLPVARFDWIEPKP